MTIIPISMRSFGFASGATDFAGKNNGSKVFAGGGGAGASIAPIGFLAVRNGNVRMISVEQSDSAAGRALEMLPETVEKIKDMFKKKDSSLED